MTVSRHIPVEPTADGPDGPICPRFELPTAWCAHCRAPRNSPPPRRRHHQRSHRSEAGAVARNGPAVAHMTYARKGGGCWLCGEPFVYAELVGVTPAGHYVCQVCL